MPSIPLGYQYDKARSEVVSVGSVVNLYPERVTANLRAQTVLYGTPGLRRWATVGNGPIRGMHVMAGVLYVISGEQAYSVASDGTATALGFFPGSGRVPMANNGEQIAALADDTSSGGYIITASEVTKITDSDFGGAESVAYIDGYFVFTGPSQFFISNLNDGTTYDAADFAAAEGNPDDLVGVLVDHREIWFYGKETIEIWWNTGEGSFPLERVQGAFVEKGTSAVGSLAKLDNTTFWLGNDHIVYRADNYTPTRISTHAIEALLGQYDDLSDCIAFSYIQEGHSFYVLTKPGAFTLVFDVATGLWHERQSYERNDWRVCCHAYAYGRNYVGDDTSGKIYRLDLDCFDEDGETLTWSVSGSPLWAEGERAYMHSLLVDFETGVGLTTGQGSDPKVWLEYSDNGGRTWSSKLFRSLGKIGEYKTRARWNRLGSFRNRTIRISGSDPVKRAALGAYAEVEGGLL